MSRENSHAVEPLQTEALAAVLSRAFYDEPSFQYMIPDEQSRFRLLPGIFQVAIRASRLHGQIYTTHDVDGGALWIGPGTGLTLERMMRTGFASTTLQWAWPDLRRCMNVGLHLDRVRQQIVRGPHWYLLAVGVEPSKQTGRIGGTLIERLLWRADSDGLPCYLETFNEKCLRFCRRHGFRIAGSGRIPKGGPDFWAMTRLPQSLPK